MLGITTALLNGFSQVFFQVNPLFGLVMAVSLAVVAPVAFALAVLGDIIAYVTSLLINAKAEHIESGFYGFSAILVALACYYTIKPLPYMIISIVIGSIISTYLYHVMEGMLGKYQLHTFAFAYVAVVWLIAVALKFLK